MKPALSPMTTGILPSRSARALTSSTTASSVTTVRMTSTNFSTGAGLKKCMPDHPARVVGGHRDLGHRQAGGVGGQDGVGLHDLVEPGEDLALEVQVLGHGLDDQVALGQVGQLGW